MRRRFVVASTLVVLVVLAVLGLAATSGFAHIRVTKTRVAIRDSGTEGVPNGRFRLALKGVAYDSGKDMITPIGGKAVIRDGQAQMPVSGSDVLTGKKGTLYIHFEGVLVNVDRSHYAEYGTWKLEQFGTAGVYKSWRGSGRWAAAGVKSNYYIEWDGLVTR
jgi:hypothetical protein